MAVRTIECSACGSTVPYGRLSCPECGELLASVAGAARRLTSITAMGDGARPMAASTTASAPEPTETAEPAWIAEPTIAPEAAEPPEPAWIAEPAEPPAEPAVTADPEPELADLTPAPDPEAVAPSIYRSVSLPGAYVPPAPVALAPVVEPAGLPAPARAWGGIGSGAGPGSSPAPAGETLSLTDPARRAEAIGWLAVAGAAVGAAGFLLPWARTIIGADGVGYLDTWGFAGPGHTLVVIGILAVLALALVKNPIPAWARLGIPGLALGSLLIGLLWPYLLGPLGPLPGAYLSLVGAVGLVIASIACLASDRHAPARSGV